MLANWREGILQKCITKDNNQTKNAMSRTASSAAGKATAAVILLALLLAVASPDAVTAKVRSPHATRAQRHSKIRTRRTT